MQHAVKFLVVLLILVFSGVGNARQDKALQGLELLRKTMAGMEDFSAEIVQEKSLSLLSEKLVSHGTVKFKKPGLFYMELYSPYASRLLLRDRVLRYRLVNDGDEEKISLPATENLTRWIEYLERPVTELPHGVDVSAVNIGKTWTLRIVPHGRKGIKALEVTFVEAGTLKRLAVDERNGDRTVITFENLRRNVGLKESEFTIK